MATIQFAKSIWMYHLNPKKGKVFKRGMPTAAANLWKLIQDEDSVLEWGITNNYKVARVGDPVIVRVNGGNKGDVTGLVAFGQIEDVNVENPTVSIRFNKATTAKLMKHPVSLEQLRRVIPRQQANIGNVTQYKAQISAWIARAGYRKLSVDDDAFAKIAKSVGKEMGIEGLAVLRTHVTHERNARNRDRVLAKHTRPYQCQECGFSFDIYGTRYGELIHVHHLKPLSIKAKPSQPRVQDFALLCANCHLVVHWKRGTNPLTLGQLRSQIGKRARIGSRRRT